VKDFHHGCEDYYRSEKAEKEIEYYLTFRGFKEKHNGFVFGLLNFNENDFNYEKIVNATKKKEVAETS